MTSEPTFTGPDARLLRLVWQHMKEQGYRCEVDEDGVEYIYRPDGTLAVQAHRVMTKIVTKN